jgi:hypothetical protein
MVLRKSAHCSLQIVVTIKQKSKPAAAFFAARTILKAMQEARRRQSLAGPDDPEWSVKLSY